MKRKFIREYSLFVLVLLIACSACFHAENEVTKILPFNYNTPNVHVFSVKATTANHCLLYADTLGFVCTNGADPLNNGFTKTSWVFLSTSGKDHYVLNPNKYSNSWDGTLCSPDSLFMHPLRNGQYRILEISSYPFLLFPLYVGKKWDWQINVGGQWSPNKSLAWSGDELFTSKYEVTDTPSVRMPFGNVSCYHIHAANSSKFGISSAEFYYSFKYGFVKMDYHPLDSTEIAFDLLTITNDPALFKSIIPNYQEGQEFMDLMKK